MADEKEKVACGDFRMDLSGAFGTCKCGFKKAEHTNSGGGVPAPAPAAEAPPIWDSDDSDDGGGGGGAAAAAVAVPPPAAAPPQPPVMPPAPAPAAAPAPAQRRRSISAPATPATPAGGGAGARGATPSSSSSSASSELAARLERRMQINDGASPASCAGGSPYGASEPFSAHREFPEFTRNEAKNMLAMFKRYDVSQDGHLSVEELKRMMEELGDPQTHLGLKAMMREVDEDGDGQVNKREFFSIFRKARDGTLQVEGLKTIVAKVVDVSAVGVGGAKDFFEAKMAEANKGREFEMEIKAEQEAKKADAQAARDRKAAFKARMAQFGKS